MEAAPPPFEQEEHAERVLVVDDDASVRGFIADVLESEPNLTLLFAEAVEPARALLAAGEEVDLIVTDIVMPGASGLDLLRWSSEAHPEIPFVVMTGQADTDAVVDALNAGAHSFLKKPFRPQELVRVVESGLSRRRYERMQDRFRRELARTNSMLRQRVIDAVVEHESLFLGSLEALAQVIDARDPYTREHSAHVSALARRTAEALGCSPIEQEAAETAGALHDIGKIAVPETILLKPGKLTDLEMDCMKEHPLRAAEILRHVPGLEEALPAIRTHHERYGGGGYPEGLSGEAIPLLGRVLAVCDTWDAMTTDRPYRKALATTTASAILEEVRGDQLDAAIVDVFLSEVVSAPDSKRPSGQLSPEHRARRRLQQEEEERRTGSGVTLPTGQSAEG